jgi:PAS domain-containing protein
MLAQDIDFYQVFKIHPTAMALLTADFEVIDVNDEMLQLAGRPLDEVVGRHAFEIFPKMPYEPGSPKWTALEAALTSGRHETNKLCRYDTEDPAHPGVFRERYWSSSVTPLRGIDGRVEFLEFSVREATAIIEQFRSLQAEL